MTEKLDSAAAHSELPMHAMRDDLVDSDQESVAEDASVSSTAVNEEPSMNYNCSSNCRKNQALSRRQSLIGREKKMVNNDSNEHEDVAANSTASDVGFMDLSRELRDMVYALYFEGKEIDCHSSRKCIDLKPRAQASHAALFLAHKTISAEAMSMMDIKSYFHIKDCDCWERMNSASLLKHLMQ